LFFIDGTLDSFIAKPPYLAKEVTAYDLAQNQGYAKVCTLLFTLQNKRDQINYVLDLVIGKLLYKKPEGFSATLFK